MPFRHSEYRPPPSPRLHSEVDRLCACGGSADYQCVDCCAWTCEKCAAWKRAILRCTNCPFAEVSPANIFAAFLGLFAGIVVYVLALLALDH